MTINTAYMVLLVRESHRLALARLQFPPGDRQTLRLAN